MNAKQNALEIIRFGRPEYAASGPPAHGVGYFGCNHESWDGVGHQRPVGSHWTDIWGVTWFKEHDGVMGFPRGNPLANLTQALRAYQWPNPDDERICAQIYAQAKGWNKEDKFLSGSHRDTLWEKCYMLGGMENMMCNFYAEPEAMREVLHRIMDFQLGIAKHYAAAGVELVGLSDDMGTQINLLLSPDIIHKFLVPEYRRLFDFYQARGVLINFHSCGHILPMVETFIELGVKILNPIQSTANDLAELRRRTQGRLALMGGINSDLILRGPIAAIREEVRKRLWQLGRHGGYFCAPDQGLPWPKEHIDALGQALKEFGRYPLQPN